MIVAILVSGLALVAPVSKAEAAPQGNGGPDWDRSSLGVTGSCQGSDAVFVITNNGSGSMSGTSTWVTSNGYTGTFQLSAGGSTTVVVPSNGEKVYITVYQRPGHPGTGVAKADATCAAAPTPTPVTPTIAPTNTETATQEPTATQPQCEGDACNTATVTPTETKPCEGDACNNTATPNPTATGTLPPPATAKPSPTPTPTCKNLTLLQFSFEVVGDHPSGHLVGRRVEVLPAVLLFGGNYGAELEGPLNVAFSSNDPNVATIGAPQEIGYFDFWFVDDNGQVSIQVLEGSSISFEEHDLYTAADGQKYGVLKGVNCSAANLRFQVLRAGETPTSVPANDGGDGGTPAGGLLLLLVVFGIVSLFCATIVFAAVRSRR